MVPAVTTWTLVLIIGVDWSYAEKISALRPVSKNWRDAADVKLLQVTTEELRSEVGVRKSRNRASSRHDNRGLGVTWTRKRACLHL